MAAPVLVDGEIWGDRRSGSRRLFSTNETVFSRQSTMRDGQDDEEALKWAALEKLPTYDRLRTAILKNVGENGRVMHEEIDVSKLGYEDRQHIIEKILKVTEEDNERFLLKLRDRIDKVGIDLPKIEVRFENLQVDANVYVGTRALPTLPNFALGQLESLLSLIRLKLTKKKVFNILSNVSGIIKPTRMTLLLGPPGSGKTSLLLALCGKISKELNVSGSITYNGHDLSEFVPRRTAAYISQHDMQLGELTVRETLDFSGRCQGVGTRYEMLTELSRREKEAGIKPEADVDIFMKATSLEGQATSLVTDYTLKLLALDICADTFVGDEMRRGISGGQRKRVTTGEMLVGPAKALFMDEISTGLDSSTTFQIVKCLRQIVHVMDSTMVISLLQPAPETFELFDDLILLSEGQIVYQGPRDLVLDFFAMMGFRCPERKGVADFLQEVTSLKDQEQYWADKRMPYQFVPVKQFVEGYKRFHVGQRLAEELDMSYDKSRSHPAALVHEKFALSGWELFKACYAREAILEKRNSFLYVFKAVQVALVALVTMTLFLRTTLDRQTLDDGVLLNGALFFGLINVMFNGFAEMALVMSRLPVFFKQRDLNLYPAWTFTLPIFITRIPSSILEAGVWVGMTYYVIGFAPGGGRFFRQFLALLGVNQMSLGLFRFVGGLGRDMIVAQTGGSFALLIIFVLGGFILGKEFIPSWWIWGYWISPLMYGQQAMSTNEFLADVWNKPITVNGMPIPDTSLGIAILKARSINTESYWYWIGVFALFGYAIVFNILFTACLQYLNPFTSASTVAVEDEQKVPQGASLQAPSASRRARSMALPVGPSNSAGISMGRRLSLSTAAPEGFDAVAESRGVIAKRGMVLPFQPLAIAFDNVSYFVDMPQEMKAQGVLDDRLQLLQNVSGAFTPGVLTALVGVSGAGKTTLMDVLAGRKTGGYIEGGIFISGFPKDQATFARISGYCEQNDIHSPHVTVYESLLYSAWLRLAREVDHRTRLMFVDQVMELVELTPVRDSLVGLPGETGLSTEQRKRLTIAVELVANPSIIFMDEPTSGLDARAAAIVMRTVRNTVDTGRTVVCTIHQPSIDIFEAFDELLLMKRGGQTIYAGPLGRESHKLVEYFEAIPGVPKIKTGYNPATWMLEVSSISAEITLGLDFAEIYKNSALAQHIDARIRELSTPGPGAKDLYFEHPYSQPLHIQFIASLWKIRISYWRNPLYNAIRMLFTLVCGLLFGSIFWGLGALRTTQSQVYNVIGSLYASVQFLGVNNSSSVQPVISIERTVFYRERAAGMYAAVPYAIAQLVIEVPYVFAQSVLYSLVVYSMVSFEWTAAKYLWNLFFIFFTLLYFTYWGMMTVAFTPNGQFAAIVSSAFYGLWNLFSGFLITKPKMPVWWSWYYWATPTAWSIYGLTASQLSDIGRNITLLDGTVSPLNKFLQDHLGYRHDFLGYVALAHVGIVLLFAFVFAFSIKNFSFQRR